MSKKVTNLIVATVIVLLVYGASILNMQLTRNDNKIEPGISLCSFKVNEVEYFAELEEVNLNTIYVYEGYYRNFYADYYVENYNDSINIMDVIKTDIIHRDKVKAETIRLRNKKIESLKCISDE